MSRVEDDGHLCLHIYDLLPRLQEHPPEILKYSHFRRDAQMIGWYAVQLAPIWFAMPGRLEVIADKDREDLPKWLHP